MAGVGSNMQQYLQGIQGLGRKLNTPTANMLGGAALGAGLSVAGNAMNGELEDKGAGRVALEALLAGAGGGLMGRLYGDGMREEAAKNRLVYDAMTKDRPLTDRYVNAVNKAKDTGGYLDLPTNIGGSALTLGATVAAGGLGGLVGGGLSNAMEMMNVPSFGSSNTASAKSGMGAATTAQPLYADGMSSDPNEQYLAYLAANQIPYA